ncbi:MAG TPA: hypothetical protein VI893_04795, partial [Thermoplasmata archaeon]|nr:hypothetical protein [Thermoplasmata archaeon]
AAEDTDPWSLQFDSLLMNWDAGTHFIEARAFDGTFHSTSVRVEVEYRPDGSAGGERSAVGLPLTFLVLVVAVLVVVVGAVAAMRRRRRSVLSTSAGHRYR